MRTGAPAAAMARLASATVASLNATVVYSDDTDIERVETLQSDDVSVDPEHAAVDAAARERLAKAISEL